MAISVHELESQAADCLPARHVLTLIGSRGAALLQEPVPDVQPPDVPSEDVVDSVVPPGLTDLLSTNQQDLQGEVDQGLDSITSSLPTDQTSGDALGALETLPVSELLPR